MRNLIKKLLRENLLERVMINDTEDLAIVKVADDEILVLMNTTTHEGLGYISYGKTDGDVFGIYGAYAKHGYGPLLYEIVMTLVYPSGITMSDDSGTSDDAINVWRKFKNRSDVIKKPINRTRKTEKEELLDATYDKDDLYYHEILDLHHTQFIYSLDKTLVNNLTEKGEEYKSKMNKPEGYYMGIVYGLES